MKIGSTILSLIMASVFIGAVVATNLQQASAFGFVERQQIGEFQKLTGEFLQNPSSIQSSLELMQSRSFARDFEIRIITAVLDDHVFEIPRIVEQYDVSSVNKPIPGKISWETYFDKTLTIFCKQCVRQFLN